MGEWQIFDLSASGKQNEGTYVGVRRRQGGIFAQIMHEYPDITIRLTLFNAEIVRGTPQLLEHNDIRWILPEEIGRYEFCPADEEILEKIKKLGGTKS